MLTVLVLIAIGLVIVATFFIVSEIRKMKDSSKNDPALQLIQSQINQTTGQINDRLDNAAKAYQQAIGDVTKELGAVMKVGDQMNAQIQNLSGFFKSSKQRGGMGEVTLNQLLADALAPNLYSTQYAFKKEGVTVDAVVKVSDKLIPIDSKFPLENYERLIAEPENDAYKKAFVSDVKVQIDSIAKKYIAPSENTIDQAIMYIPSEAVFYEIATNFELMEYSRKKSVVPASPSLLYIYLKQVMSVYQIGRLAQEGKKILKGMRGVQEESVKMGKEIELLDKHMKDARNSSEVVSSRFGKLTGKIENVMLLEVEEAKELLELEKETIE